MSRSRRHNPWMPLTCCKSEKYEKQKARKALRRRNKLLYQRATDDVLLYLPRELADCWNWGKDGRQLITDSRYMRK